MTTERISIAIARGTFGGDREDEAPAGMDVHLRLVDASDLNQLSAINDCSGLIVGLQTLSESHLSALPEIVKVIGRAGIGLDSIDLVAAENAGISVVHQPSYATNEVAEHAIALMMALLRQIPAGDRAARTAWPSWDIYQGVPSLSDCTLGLVGVGRIGAAVARRALPLVGRILAFDPVATSVSGGVELVSDLSALLEQSDIVSLHAPLTDATAGLMNAEKIGQMRQGSFLVNVSRGGLVDESALAAALADGRLRGAALDVLSAEPPAPDNPMLNSPRTILSPHAAWLSRSSQERLRSWTMNDVIRVASGYSPSDGRLAVQGHRSGSLQD